MVDFISRKLLSNPSQYPRVDFSSAERIIYWVIVLTPVWWLLGIQTLLYPGIAFGLLIANFDFDKLFRRSVPICVLAWLAMSLTMLWTAILGLDNIGYNPLRTAAAMVTLCKSYLLIFVCLWLPFFARIRVRVITRAVAWLSASYLVSLIVQVAMLLLHVGGGGFAPPLAKLIPGDQLSTRVAFAVFQPFFRIPLPRTSLYTPDPPILGVCSVLFFFICLGESDRRLRRISLAGCLVALVISQSRSAWIFFPLALLVMTLIRSGLIRQRFLWFASFYSFLCTVLGLGLKELLDKPTEVFTSARAESSRDRELVVRKTIEAWQQKPWLGWGTIQGSVKWYIYNIALGSFSTYPSVLYLHGIFGFTVFLFALATTLWKFWGLAVRGNLLSQRAVASLVALYLLCNATPLTWMTVYFWFYYIWLGAIMVETDQERVSSWEELARRPIESSHVN